MKTKKFKNFILSLNFTLIAIHSFSQYSKLLDFDSINSGSYPYGYLISDGNYLFGLTSEGGINNEGTIFKIKRDGSGYNKLFDFNEPSGSNPYGSLVFDGSFLYGTATNGGNKVYGTIFKIKPDGTGFDTLKNFGYLSTEPANPNGSLYFDGTFLYGTTSIGSTNNNGNVFRINQDGNYESLFDFNDTNNIAIPHGDLVFDGLFFYGMTGSYDDNYSDSYPQYIYRIKPDGTNFTKIFNFDSINGLGPTGGLIYEGDFLYGMTSSGGKHNKGLIFKIKPDGSAFDTLINFNGSNGSHPYGSLVYDGSFLFGTTYDGGAYDLGTLFKIKPDGTSYFKLLDFSGTTDGSYPNETVMYDGQFLYGMTSQGGTNNYGTIFKYQYCSSNCCYSNYNTTYNQEQNTFVLTLDPSTVSYANSFLWDFGDGNTSTSSTPSHIYTIDTSYNVCLKIKTTSNDSCSYCNIIGKNSFGNIYRTGGFTIKVVAEEIQTSIDNFSTNNILIFPNPSNGLFSLTITNKESLNITIEDIIGETIYQALITTPITEIDLRDQPNGIYLVTIETGGETTKQKVIIYH